jgi:uncharacterized membrane protein YfcA
MSALSTVRRILDLWRRGDFWDVAFENRPWSTSAVFGLLSGVGGGGIGGAIGESTDSALGIAAVLACVGLFYFRFWTGPRALQRRERQRRKDQRRNSPKGRRRRP